VESWACINKTGDSSIVSLANTTELAVGVMVCTLSATVIKFVHTNKLCVNCQLHRLGMFQLKWTCQLLRKCRLLHNIILA